MSPTGTLDFSAKLADVAPCQKELRVEIPPEKVAAEFDAVYQELKKSARVPGFRVGFAPRDLLERYHGQTAKEEALERLVSRSLGEALEAHKDLDPVGRPQVTDLKWEPKQPLSYVAKIETAPAVPLGPYKGLKLTRPKMEVKEEALTQVLARLQDSQAQLKPVSESRLTAEGDYLLVDLTEQKKGAAPAKRRDMVIHLDLQKDPEGLLKELVALMPPAQKTITLKTGETLTVDVKQVKTKEVPPLDDALAKSVGPFESLENLKNSIRDNMRKEAERNQRHALEEHACQRLLEQWTFDVPPSLVGSQARRNLKERSLELMSQGLPQTEVQERGQVLAEQAKMEALKQVKLFFILRRIASAAQITATEEEMEAKVQALAAGMNVPVEQFRADLEAKDLLEEMVWSIIRQKVFDNILKEADISEGKND